MATADLFCHGPQPSLQQVRLYSDLYVSDTIGYISYIHIQYMYMTGVLLERGFMNQILCSGRYVHRKQAQVRGRRHTLLRLQFLGSHQL